MDSGDALIDWAGEALVAGWDSLPLSILAGLDRPSNAFETDRYLSAALTSLGLAMPDKDQAARLLATIIAGEIVSGDTSPQVGCKELCRASPAAGYPDFLAAFVGLDAGLGLAEDGLYGTVESAVKDIVDEAQRLVDEGAGQD